MNSTPPAPDTRTTGSRGRTLFVSAVGVIVGAGLVAGLVLGLGGRPSATPSPPDAPLAHQVPPTPPSTPRPPAPSAAVAALQRELSRLEALAAGRHRAS